MARNTKNLANEKCTLYDLEIGKKAKKSKKWDTTVFNLEYGEKYPKTFKMRNAHCENWSMVRKLKIMENEKHTVGHGIRRETLKNLKNEKCTV